MLSLAAFVDDVIEPSAETSKGDTAIVDPGVLFESDVVDTGSGMCMAGFAGLVGVWAGMCKAGFAGEVAAWDFVDGWAAIVVDNGSGIRKGFAGALRFFACAACPAALLGDSAVPSIVL